MNEEEKAITVSSNLPLVLRVLFGTVALVMMVLLVRELGAALWPLNLMSLFFGIILVGGLQVLVAFLAFVVAAPDTIWTFRPGRIEIENRLPGKSDRFVLPTDDMAIDVICNDDGDGPATWHLDLAARWPARPGPMQWLHTVARWFPRAALPQAIFLDRMRSPGFSSSIAAEAALALVRSKGSMVDPRQSI